MGRWYYQSVEIHEVPMAIQQTMVCVSNMNVKEVFLLAFKFQFTDISAVNGFPERKGKSPAEQRAEVEWKLVSSQSWVRRTEDLIR